MAVSKAAPAKEAAPAKTGNSDIIAQFEGICMRVASAIPILLFKTWVSAYFHPVETLEKEKANISAMRVVKSAGLLGLIIGVLVMIIIVISTLMQGQATQIIAAIIAGIIAIALYIVIVILGMFVMSLIYFVFAKLFGGKGSYMPQTVGLTFVGCGTSLIRLPLTILGMVPCVGFVFSLISLPIAIYGFYSEYRVIKNVHGLSRNRAIATLLVPWIILGVLLVIAVLVMGAAMMAMFATMAKSGALSS
ncbi:MAG: YIP1 family protein [Candidatus Micrarchaeota archaeon]|nr:YIP1 family protein [Candidatus Micrarchaeota archaeon]